MKQSIKRVVRAVAKVVLSPVISNRHARGLFYDSHPPDSLLLADCGTEKYVVNTSDRVIGRHCYASKKSFDVEKLRVAIKLLPDAAKRTDLIDIGGNIGTISIYALANGIFERSTAFEPEPNNFRLLELNNALNGMTDKLSLHNIALSDGSTTELQFELSKNNYGDHRVRVHELEGGFEEAGRETISVPAGMLDDFKDAMNYETAMIWMDVQGFEGYVLNGATDFIKNRVPMVAEFWPYGMSRAGSYELFVSAILGGNYSTLIDLENPAVKLECTNGSFEKLRDSMAGSTRFTDLLIY